MSEPTPGRGLSSKRGHWLRYWFGRYGLRHGWCPACNSSPPRSECRVCEGTHEYGPQLSDLRRALWRDRFDRLTGRL